MKKFFPIMVVPAVPHEGGIRFLQQRAQMDIGPKIAEKVWKVLSYANGYNDVKAIAKLAELPDEEVEEIFAELEEFKVVVDAREQFKHFHAISNYPSAVNCDLTQDEIVSYTNSITTPEKAGERIGFKYDETSALKPIIEKRRSCRNFSRRPLDVNTIGSICHYGYSISDHAVPSGGALYPLKVYVLIEREQKGIEAGYYEYDATLDILVKFAGEVDEEQLKYCFNQEEMPFGSSVQIVIAADLMRQPYKYANRGYRLTLMEAGHAAENMCLYAAEKGLGACEMGGVLDESLKEELRLDGEIWPLVAIAVGYPAKHEEEPFNKIRYVEENVGKDHPVKEIYGMAFHEGGTFFSATTTYRDGHDNLRYAGATSTSYADAMFKATIEGYERWLSSRPRVDYFRGPARELRSWLDPRVIFPLTDEQAKAAGLESFSEDLPLDWVKGKTYDGRDIYVPTDIVYYGQKSGENRIYFGHSSGIAAYSRVGEAEKRALVELIERDGIMQNWYLRDYPAVVGEDLLPVHARKRMEYWAERGRALKVLQLKSEYGWVFEVVIVSDNYPCFISGAAATIDHEDIDGTILKAIQEAELGLLLALENPDDREILPEAVESAADHGRLYHAKRYADQLAWLTQGETEKDFMSPRLVGMDQLFTALEPVFVNMSEKGSNLSVVRALSPELVPINFGYHLAHFTHPALKGVVHPDSLKLPHYFA